MQIAATTTIDRPADAVFAFIADSENNLRWQEGMQSCIWTSEPPIRVGSTYDQEARFIGRPIRSSFEVTEFEEGRRIRIETTSGTMPIDVTRSVEPIGEDRCRVTAIVGGGPGGLMRLLDPLMARMVKRSVTADYARLKALLEDGGGA